MELSDIDIQLYQHERNPYIISDVGPSLAILKEALH
jgi:hypothetical protein